MPKHFLHRLAHSPNWMEDKTRQIELISCSCLSRHQPMPARVRLVVLKLICKFDYKERRQTETNAKRNN